MRRSDLNWLWSNRPLLISQIVGAPLVILWFLNLYYRQHDSFALVLLCLIPVFAVVNVAMITRSRRRLSDRSARRNARTGQWLRPVSARSPQVRSMASGRWIGAADLPGTMGRMNASTPLAVLDLAGGTLTLRVRPGFLAAMFGTNPLVVVPREVEAVYPARARFRHKAIAIRPHGQPPSYFLTVETSREPILTAIAAAGFPVWWDEREFSYS